MIMDFSSFIQTNLFTLHTSQVEYKMVLSLGETIDSILYSFITLKIKWRQVVNLFNRVLILNDVLLINTIVI